MSVMEVLEIEQKHCIMIFGLKILSSILQMKKLKFNLSSIAVCLGGEVIWLHV